MTSARKLELGTVISVAGVDYTVAAFVPFNGTVKLVPLDKTAAIVWMSVAEIAMGREAVAGPPLQMPEDAEWPIEVRQMAAHIREVLEGEPVLGDRRPEYASTVPLMQRYDKKVAELQAAGVKISTATLRRRVAAFREGGMAALAAAMGCVVRAVDGLPKIDVRIRDAIIQVISEKSEASTPTQTRLIVEVRAELARRYPDLPELRKFSNRTFRRWVDVFEKGNYTFANARTRQTAANSPRREHLKGNVVRPGERVEIDSTPLDVMVRGLDGKPCRLELTAMIDVATRSLVSWGFTSSDSSGFDHSMLLARALVPPRIRPGQEALALRSSTSLPSAALIALDERRADSLDMPFIFPEEITMDGGASFRGTVFESACLRYGITLNYASPRTPTHKPHIERFFSTVNATFAQYLAGYTGTDVSQRGKKVDAVWDIAGIERLFELWYCQVYLDTPHEGLRDPLYPSVVWTPRQYYAATVDVAAGVPIPFTRDDYIAIMPIARRQITRHGIRHNNRTYDSRDLDGLRDRQGPLSGAWSIHYDPYSPESVWVYHPDRECWVEARDKNLWLTGRSGIATELSRQLIDSTAPLETRDDADRQEVFHELVTTQEAVKRRKSRRPNHFDGLPQPQGEQELSPMIETPTWDDEVDDEAYELIDYEKN